MRTQRIVWFADLETLSQTPSRLSELRDQLGITTIWLESHRYHTAGFALSAPVWERSPFKDWNARPSLTRHRFIHHLAPEVYPVLPGILAGADDAPLRSILSATREARLEVWGHLGLWSYAGMMYPEYSLRGLNGELMPEAEDHWGSAFCPNQPAINVWLGDCLEDCITKYPIDGIEVDHARFLPPASLPNLLACTCPLCCASAAAVGENLPSLAALIKDGIERTGRLKSLAVMQAMVRADNLATLPDAFLLEQAGSRWLKLRGHSIAQNLNWLAAQAHRVAGNDFVFGADLFPPSVAELGGHRYADLDGLDYFTGGFGLVGWESSSLNTCAAWGACLFQQWPDLNEGVLVDQLLRLAGLTGLSLPRKLDALQQPSVDCLVQVVETEIERLAATRPAGRPCYPPINLATLGVAGACRVIIRAAECQLEGFVLSGLENLSPEQVVQLGDCIGSCSFK